MKPSTKIGIAATALFAVLGLPVETIAQQPSTAQDERSGKTRYTIVDLGPVGPLGQPYMISKNGLIAGFAAAPDGTSYHATLWFHTPQGVDIGTPGLGGPNSFSFGVNERGEAAGPAQTSDPDPYNEDFCGFNALGFTPSNATCLPYVWRNGAMHPLPTLGGPNGYAFMINNRNEIVGLAETAVEYGGGCPVHQFVPTVWKHGKPTALSTPHDLYGVAAYINDKGQVSGASGDCVPFNFDSYLYLIENHAMLWDADGTPHELQTLGGTGPFGNHACAINNLGQAVGHAQTPDGTTAYGVVWLDPGKAPSVLMPLNGDVASFSLGINDETTVVGTSITNLTTFQSTAFAWQKGAAAVTDLNTLIRYNPSGLYLAWAESINNRGEIVGYGATSTGEIHGFLAVPCERDDDADADIGGSAAMPRPVLSDQARQLLRRLLARP